MSLPALKNHQCELCEQYVRELSARGWCKGCETELAELIEFRRSQQIILRGM